MAYKLKIGPAQGLKLKGQAGFALPLIGGTGIATAKSSGVWTVSLDFSEIQTGTVNDDTAYILTWDSASEAYTRLTVTDLVSGFSGDFATAAQGAAADSAVQPGDLGDLAFKDTIVVPTDITATGTPSGTTYLRGDGVWDTPAGGGGGGAAEYDTVAALNAATVDPSSNSVVTLGYYAIGDGGGTRYVRVGSVPSKPGYQTSDGGTVYWDLSGRSRINVKWLGAKGDASTDDLTAIQDSITALENQPTTGVPGGTVYFPTGEYHVSSTAFDLLNSRSITFEGDGSGYGLLYPSSFVVLTSTGSVPLVKLDGTQGIRFSHLGMAYNSALYTGNLVELTTDVGSSVTSFTTIEDFYIGGIGGGGGPSGAASCINARNTLQTYLSRGFIHHASIGICGGVSASTDFNNLMVIDSVWFDNRLSVAPILAGGQNWVVRNCAFEPPTSVAGQPRGIISAPLGMSGMTVDTCNFADASETSSSWIDFSNNFGSGVPGRVQGVTITNNLFQGAGTMIILGSNCQGLEITGNQFYMPAVNTAPISGGASATKLEVWRNRILSLAGEGVGNIIDSQPTDRRSLVDRNDGNCLSFGPAGTNYVYLPGKKLMAWGTALSIGTGATAVLFGVTFASAPVVTATPNGAPSATAVGVSAATTTGFSAYVGSGSLSVNWIAIGTAP